MTWRLISGISHCALSCNPRRVSAAHSWNVKATVGGGLFKQLIFLFIWCFRAMRWWRASNVLPFTLAVWFSEKVTYLEHSFVWDCLKKQKTASTSLFFSRQALFNWPHFKMRLHSNQVCLHSSVCVALPRLLCYISVLAVRPVRRFISFSSVFPACSAVSVISCSYSVLLSHFHTALFSCCVVALIVFTCADYVQPRLVGLCVSLLCCFVLVSLDSGLLNLKYFSLFLVPLSLHLASSTSAA